MRDVFLKLQGQPTREKSGRRVRGIGLACLLAAACVLSQGCIAYRSEVAEGAGDFARQAGGALRARLTVNGESVVNGQVHHLAHMGHLKSHRAAALKVFRESGLFEEVGPHVSGPDIEIVIETDTERSLTVWLEVVSTLTFKILPSWSTVTTRTKARLATRDGRPLGDFSATGSVRIIEQILFLPFCPSLGITGSWAREDTYKSIAVQMSKHPAVRGVGGSGVAARKVVGPAELAH